MIYFGGIFDSLNMWGNIVQSRQRYTQFNMALAMSTSTASGIFLPSSPQCQCHAAMLPNSNNVEIKLCRVKLTASYSSSTGDLSVNSGTYTMLIQAYLSLHTQLLLRHKQPHCLLLITKAKKRVGPYLFSN